MTFAPSSDPAFCLIVVELIGFAPSTDMPMIFESSDPVPPLSRTLTTNENGYALGTPIGSYRQTGTQTLTVTAEGLTTGALDIAC